MTEPLSPSLTADLALFVASVSDRATFLVSPTGAITYWNTGAESVFGYPADAILGGSIDRLCVGEPEKLRRDQQRAIAEGTLRQEEWCLRRDGSEFLADVTVVPLRTEERVRGFGYSVVDVTRRRAAEQMLAENEAHMRSVLETVLDPMVVIDERGLILSFSAAAERLLGYTEREVIGQNVNILMPDDHRRRHDGYISRYLETGERRIIGIGRIVVGQRKDGSQFPMELSVGEASGTSGRIFTGFIRDLTEKQRAELRLKELQAELIHVSRLSAMGTMASTLAHELNQPLTAIANYLEAARDLLDGGADERELLREAVDQSAQEALRAGHIVRRLRDFVARGETERRVEDLPVMIEEASRLGMIGARERGVRCFTDLDPDARWVVADRVQVQQVLVNLLRNAVDALRNGEVCDITVATGRDGDMIRVSVADTGPGLDPMIAPRLFQAFASSKADGMGLGLSICRTIVEAHGGRIWAERGAERGAVFHFTLPAGEPEQEGAEP